MSTPHLPQEIWDHEIAAIQEPAAAWLWQGFLAKGNITLLTSLWKSGKTTLVANLLACRKLGRPLAGLPVQAGKSVVITEEPRQLWAERARCHDFGGNLCLFPQPFLRLPTPDEWQALIERIALLSDHHGVDLVVIDPLAHFVRQENLAHSILDTLLPLRTLTRRGMAALVLHHPPKHESTPGQTARGHGALSGHVDIAIEMRHAGPDLDTRARRFFCLSRHAATPRHFLFELNAAGTDYVPIADAADEDFHVHWDKLRMVLDDAPQKLTRQDILDEWPPDFPKPAPATLWKWLTHAVQTNLILTEGTGRKADPFRYWLPTSVTRWREQSICYDIVEQQRRELKLPFESLAEYKRRQRGIEEG